MYNACYAKGYLVAEYTWRDILQEVISNQQTRIQLADKLKVAPITLLRWAAGETSPSSERLKQLLTVFPDDHKDQFQQHLVNECPDIFQS